ncbi:recombination regulator RecX [Lactobacillus sp. ESL0791]|uniref:recombination regulator RecX n=1 Tax=Lactobacillus sp. ESL0791 TaxID=2983234 RepID=UPI0023F7621F|nr:recombination regulator RecX [Lactobacillus sp. ESL0791]MDF7638535.1 recombination regulator RecX [Lactobacillus sp. ESL0791]
MPLITKVSAQKRADRYNIFLDGKYAFSASQQTVAEFILLQGQELTNEKITEIKQFDADAKATNLASRFLSYEPRTIFEILQYLKKHGISDESADSAVDQLTNLGYLDDQKYVKLVLQNNLRIGSDGPRAVLQKLSAKGVAPETSQLELKNVADEAWLPVGQRVLKSMKSKIGKMSERELKQKMRAKLLTHGFDSGFSELILDEIDLTADDDDQLDALKKQGIKAYKKFRRFTGSERERKIRNYLFTHGFSSTEINSFLAGEVISEEELDEY